MTALPGSEEHWLAVLGGIPQWQAPVMRTLVIAPHPDDEVLGVGGLIAAQRRRFIPVRVLAVTDGEAAYPDTPGLGKVREAEQQKALAELAVGAGEIVRLHLPDGSVEEHESRLARELARHMDADILVVAPWRFDPHPDHEACGRAALRAAQSAGATLVSYLFWAWHRQSAEPLENLPLRRFDLDADLQRARAAALSHHRSQLEHEDGAPILPATLLGPAQRPFETVILHD